MKKNDLLRMKDSIYRVLVVSDTKFYAIDCKKQKMPKWFLVNEYIDCIVVSEEEMRVELDVVLLPEEELTHEQVMIARKRYTMVCAIVPFLDNDELRNEAIARVSSQNGLSRRTVTSYLSTYLSTMDISALAGHGKAKDKKSLTIDQKNMRWALKKFYYTRHGNTITDAYVMMLKEKYTDDEGKLLKEHPTIYQFRYFFQQNRKKQTEIISREGIKEYQLNHRPLLGDGVQEFAPTVGTFALDATVCDLYLVDDAGKLIGRPILVAAVDMNCGLCCGYSLLWEGGVYSVRELMLNIIRDKVEWCKKFGIIIDKKQWNCSDLPGVFITDRGSEYISFNAEQITELGCQVISLPSFSANMKGPVEKLFDLVQDGFKPYLKGKGVIEADFQKRGIRDYRKDACLTIHQFEQIIIRCILYHNNSRVLENYPYTDDMLNQSVAPYASAIWNYAVIQGVANLIHVKKERLVLTLLPRTEGKFSRRGLLVNKLRYQADGYTEQYLRGEKVIVSYNPDDVSNVWLIDNGEYIKFELIERRYSKKSLDDVLVMKKKQKQYCKGYSEENLQARVELANHIEAIAAQAVRTEDTDIKGITKRRQAARRVRHNNIMEEV